MDDPPGHAFVGSAMSLLQTYLESVTYMSLTELAKGDVLSFLRRDQAFFFDLYEVTIRAVEKKLEDGETSDNVGR